MRFVRFGLRLVAALGLAYLYFATLHPVHPVPDHPYFDRPAPWVIAHQGGRGLWPENTLYAFEHARDLGVDVIEMDLQVSSDDHIVVLHDASVDRTTDGHGLVREKTLAELTALDAGYRFEAAGDGFPFRGSGLRVPELKEVLETLEASKLNLEMKAFTPRLAEALCEELRAFDATARVLVASFEQEPMDAFRSRCPEVATSATMREGLAFLRLSYLRLESLFRSPATAFQVPETFGEIRVVEPRFLRLAKALNIRVQVWTVNDPEAMRRLLGLGAHGILTDYPDRLLAILGRVRQP